MLTISTLGDILTRRYTQDYINELQNLEVSVTRPFIRKEKAHDPSDVYFLGDPQKGYVDVYHKCQDTPYYGVFVESFFFPHNASRFPSICEGCGAIIYPNIVKGMWFHHQTKKLIKRADGAI